MSNEVDYYDVQGMIRDARAEIRGEIANAVGDAMREFRAGLGELREYLGAERVERQDAIESLRESLTRLDGR